MMTTTNTNTANGVNGRVSPRQKQVVIMQLVVNRM